MDTLGIEWDAGFPAENSLGVELDGIGCLGRCEVNPGGTGDSGSADTAPG